MEFLNSSGIQDMQLIPSPTLEDLYLRVYHYTPPKGALPLTTQALLQRSMLGLSQLCIYQYKQECKVESLVPVRLDGMEMDREGERDQYDSLKSSDLALGDTFTLETYRVVFKS